MEFRYKKFDWIEVDVIKHTSDLRVESYRPVNHSNIRVLGRIETKNDWRDRNSIVLGKAEIHTNLAQLIQRAKTENISLAVFKPTEITAFHIRSENSSYDPDKFDKAKKQLQQLDLFEDNTWREQFNFVNKLPCRFLYTFCDDEGTSSTMSILDWEIGSLFWNVYFGDRALNIESAKSKVQQKYEHEFMKRDLYFLLGTTKEHHWRAPNPFTIVGVYYPPRVVDDEEANLWNAT
jgi:hypothetical protein